MNASHRGLSRFLSVSLAYTLLVIVWGAYVRATGSGAGCGDHWPLCNGEVIPRAERIQTVIEFVHRLSSGLSLLLVVFGFLWIRRVAQLKSTLHRLGRLTVIAILLEALLGAGLVLFKLVEFDQSVARTVSIGLHLINTLFLVTAQVMVWYFSKFSEFYQRSETSKGFLSLIPKDFWFRVAALGFVMIGVTGAIAALGDTLFPVDSLREGLEQELHPSAHFLVRLRVFHPIFAFLWVGGIVLYASRLKQYRGWLVGAVMIQFVLGLVNWVLLAPVWMQLVHLLMADLVWILVWFVGLKHERDFQTQAR